MSQSWNLFLQSNLAQIPKLNVLFTGCLKINFHWKMADFTWQVEKRNLRWTVILQVMKTFSRSVVSDSLRPHGSQHARLPCPSPTPGACSNSYPSSWWCHPTISSSAVPFYSWLPGASVRNPARGKGHEAGSLTYAKVWSGFRGSPWVFLNIYPQKPESACLIVLCFPLFWHNRGYPRPPFSGKS